MIRPRRSLLYMPGSNRRALEKARILPVDGVILDLEDSVAPSAKTLARQQVLEAIQAGGFGSREIFLRINAVGTLWHEEDFVAAVEAAPDAILIPKVTSPEDLLSLGRRLSEIGANPNIALWAMIETPLALFHALAIAATSKEPVARLGGFVIGTNDLARETSTRIVPGRAPMLPWLMTCIAAARAHGIAIIDGVYNDLGDPGGFERECSEARDMGFDGKSLIHPNQISPCNEHFSPTESEIAEARRVMTAFDLPENQEKGVIDLDGHMVERLHAAMARRTVAIADAIVARETEGS